MFSPPDLTIRAAPGIGLIAALPWFLPSALFLAASTHGIWLAAPGAGCLVAGVLAYRRHGLHRGAGGVTHLGVSNGRLWMTTATDGRREVTVAPESRITHRFLWLRLDDGHRNHTLLLSDRPGFRNTEPEPLRRLTVWLRYGLQPGRDTHPESGPDTR